MHVKASSRLGFMLLAGEPLREPIVQHGPFVMSTQDQIMQAFQDYHSGSFLAEECTYKLHTKGKTTTTKRRIEGRRSDYYYKLVRLSWESLRLLSSLSSCLCAWPKARSNRPTKSASS